MALNVQNAFSTKNALSITFSSIFSNLSCGEGAYIARASFLRCHLLIVLLIVAIAIILLAIILRKRYLTHINASTTTQNTDDGKHQ